MTFGTPDGATLSYRTLGEPSATRTLVCHPGGPGMSGDYFGDVAGLGSASLRVVVLNPRGTGGSPPPGDGRYQLEGYAADLDALRAHLGLGRIDLLGHSHGGAVGMIYALEHPDGLDRLILASSAPRFGPEWRQEEEAAFAAHSARPWYEDALDARRRRQAWEFNDSEQAAALYVRELPLWFASDGPATDAFVAQMKSQRPDIEALRYFNENIGAELRPALTSERYPRADADPQRRH